MALFGLGKKKENQDVKKENEVKETTCCCGGNCTSENMEQAERDKKSMELKFLVVDVRNVTN